MEVMHQVNKRAWERMEMLQEQMLKIEPVLNPKETYKSYQHKEMIRIRAEEIVLHEIIYQIH